MKDFHASEKLACGRRWRAPMQLTAGSVQNIRHICRAHVVTTGECLCPCGARHAPEPAAAPRPAPRSDLCPACGREYPYGDPRAVTHQPCFDCVVKADRQGPCDLECGDRFFKGAARCRHQRTPEESLRSIAGPKRPNP